MLHLNSMYFMCPFPALRSNELSRPFEGEGWPTRQRRKGSFNFFVPLRRELPLKGALIGFEPIKISKDGLFYGQDIHLLRRKGLLPQEKNRLTFPGHCHSIYLKKQQLRLTMKVRSCGTMMLQKISISNF